MGRKQKIILGMIGIVLGYGVLSNLFVPTAMAAEPSITISKGDLVGNNELKASKNSSDSRNYYIPFTITTKDVSKYTVSVYAENPNMVGQENPSNVIKSVKGDKEYTLGEMQNEWGYRWNLGDKLEDAYLKNFSAVPTVSTELATYTPTTSGTSLSYFVIGFGAGVNNELPKDTYSNKIMVSFVAEPVTTSIFSITNMQDMKPDICEATTTPNVDAINTDTTGEHAGDPSYVPEVTLIDTRGGSKDGKGEYLVRKLADGNCWMVQNLELDILSKGGSYGTGNQTVNDTFHLTNEDTDLNSMTDFTPTIAAEKYNNLKTYATSQSSGTSWQNNGLDGLRSYNYARKYSNPTGKSATGALTFTSSANPVAIGIYDVSVTAASGSGTTVIHQFYNYGANAGMVSYIGFDATRGASGEYQRYGNLYNWTAATLGSGINLKVEGQVASDSICPRGWKLPANATDADDSFANLLGEKYYNVSNNLAGYNKVNNWPLSFLRTGYYINDSGIVWMQEEFGGWWTSQARDYNATLGSRYLSTHPDYVQSRYPGPSGFGFALRCVAR